MGLVVSLEINLTTSLAVTIPTKVPSLAVMVLNPGFVPPLPVITKGWLNLFFVDNWAEDFIEIDTGEIRKY